MGKRKSRSKQARKLDTVFDCPCCNYQNSVECKINLKNKIGVASCRICQNSFRTTDVNALTEPIDIYSEWIDENEREIQRWISFLEEDSD